MGLEVKLPTGYIFQGNITAKYIQVGYDLGTGRMVEDGLWSMDLEGMKSAIADAKKYEQEMLKNQ